MFIARAVSAIRREGLRDALTKRIAQRYRNFQVNNYAIGRAIELFGNRVRMDGMIFSVDCPLITTPHKSTLAFGMHEIEERELIQRWLPENIPILEFGGGLGVISCLINRKLSRPTDHIVVEANPTMIPILKRNRDLNRCKFRIINKAIAYDRDFVDLALDSDFVGTRISSDRLSKQVLSVPTTTVRQLLDQTGFGRVGIVCDVEGAEADMISREMPTLQQHAEFTRMAPTLSSRAPGGEPLLIRCA
jgi:FkbM family methyltransferase